MLVESALRHLNDLPALSEHALLSELGVDDGTPLERASVLRGALAVDLAQRAARQSPSTSSGATRSMV